MNTIIRISEVLFQKYGFYVPLAESGYESHLFYKEQIDEELVPKNKIFVRNGKGGKYREIPISTTLAHQLTQYKLFERPKV